MRLTIIPFLCLLGSVIAIPIELAPRDSSVIERSLKRVLNSMTKLDNGMKQRRSGGDTREAQKETNGLVQLGKDLVEELRLGSREVRRGPAVNSFEAIALLQGIDNLTRVLQSITNGWIDSKRMVLAAGSKATVLNLLLDASEGSTVFSDAIISKLPLLEQTLGQQFKTTFTMIIEMAIKEYRI
jgi:hypothetical protein